MYLYCIPPLFIRSIRFIAVRSGQIYCSVYAILKLGMGMKWTEW